MKNSFKPCLTCSQHCPRAGRPSKEVSAIEAEISKEDIKRNGCLYDRTSNK